MKRKAGKREYFMRETENIRAAALEDSVTLFWDKKEPGACRYEIFAGEERIAEARQTYYVCGGLSPDTEYVFTVRNLLNGREGSVRARTAGKKRRIDVTAEPYQAVGDGKTMNTGAIQRAIDDCGRDEAVYVPAGVFLVGALFLHSDMELYLEEGAVLQGADCPEAYLPKIRSRFEGIETECYSSLLNLGRLDGEDFACENVIIRGKGVIAGGGRTLAERMIETERKRLKAYLETLGDRIREYENADTIPGRSRGRLINMSRCRNIRITGLTLKDGASWNVHMIYSRGIVTDHCEFHSGQVWNGDGWDPDSSEDCTLFGCKFYTGDDSVAIKSGKNPEGNRIARPCRRIRIFNCESACGHGITIGSEMSGGVEDVRIWDCDMSRSMFGIEIKGTKKRGGYVRDVRVMDTAAPRILIHSVAYNDDGEGAGHPPVFEDCSFEHMRLTGKYLEKDGELLFCREIELRGFDVPGYEVRNIAFRDIETDKTPELSMKYCRDITVESIR